MKSQIPYKEIVYDRVSYIPSGHVVTYGQIAEGLPGITARMVGTALSKTPEGTVIPWHRVVNSGGKISMRGDGDSEELQKILLEKEGVVFKTSKKIDLKIYKWIPNWPEPSPH